MSQAAQTRFRRSRTQPTHLVHSLVQLRVPPRLLSPCSPTRCCKATRRELTTTRPGAHLLQWWSANACAAHSTGRASACVVHPHTQPRCPLLAGYCTQQPPTSPPPVPLPASSSSSSADRNRMRAPSVAKQPATGLTSTATAAPTASAMAAAVRPLPTRCACTGRCQTPSDRSPAAPPTQWSWRTAGPGQRRRCQPPPSCSASPTG